MERRIMTSATNAVLSLTPTEPPRELSEKEIKAAAGGAVIRVGRFKETVGPS
jgi:hypothetical protein